MKALIILFLTCNLFAQSPKLLLLKEYKDQNVSGFLMSEKLDGIRAFWNGKELLSRNGKIIHAPKWFTKGFPPFEIDGELWSKRGEFELIQSIIMDKNPSKEWEKITYNIFEVPNQKGGLKERLNVLDKYLKTTNAPSIRIIKQIHCKDKNHLQSNFEQIIKHNGEGVVLRDPSALYINKRTNKAVKLKNYTDTECEVIAHHKGKGKYKNTLGAFTCKLANGVTFKIGSGLSDKLRQNPPKIGEIVTFKYQGFTKNKKPRFPIFLHVRK